MRYRALMALCGALAGCAGQPQPSDAERLKSVQTTNAALRDCGTREVASLDDGISPAPIIAKGLASRCLVELTASVLADGLLVPSLSDRIPADYERARNGDNATLLEIVLTHRVSRR